MLQVPPDDPPLSVSISPTSPALVWYPPMAVQSLTPGQAMDLRKEFAWAPVSASAGTGPSTAVQAPPVYVSTMASLPPALSV